MARPGRSTFSAQTCPRRASIARAMEFYSQFEVQRGLGINQMIRWFEECVDGWRAVEPLAQAGALPGSQSARAGAASRWVRHRPVPASCQPEPDKKALAFDRIAGAMAEEGWLMLGAGETVIGQTTKLGADVNARGLYRQIGDGRQSKNVAAPTGDGFGGLTRTAVSCAITAHGRDHRLPSPNCDERALRVSMIVLHYTGMPDAQSALDWLPRPRPGCRRIIWSTRTALFTGWSMRASVHGHAGKSRVARVRRRQLGECRDRDRQPGP